MSFSSGSSLDKTRRLWAIARRVLAPERSYTQEHVTAKLETYLKINEERAKDGFNLMIKEGVLSRTCGEPCKYYLSDTTPF